MDKNNKNKDKKKATPISIISGDDSGMVCGPDGCDLTGHFDWAKKDKEKK